MKMHVQQYDTISHDSESGEWSVNGESVVSGEPNEALERIMQNEYKSAMAEACIAYWQSRAKKTHDKE